MKQTKVTEAIKTQSEYVARPKSPKDHTTAALNPTSVAKNWTNVVKPVQTAPMAMPARITTFGAKRRNVDRPKISKTDKVAIMKAVSEVK